MKKLKTVADQNARMHLIGRLWLIGGMLLICTIPLWLALYYDVEPMWEVFGTSAVISPFILMALSGIAEPIVYSPMVGVNGMYLSFLTGNLSNLKIASSRRRRSLAPSAAPRRTRSSPPSPSPPARSSRYSSSAS